MKLLILILLTLGILANTVDAASCVDLDKLVAARNTAWQYLQEKQKQCASAQDNYQMRDGYQYTSANGYGVGFRCNSNGANPDPVKANYLKQQALLDRAEAGVRTGALRACRR